MQTKVEHTKRPWNIDEKLSGSENHRGFMVRDSEGHWIGDISPRDTDGEEGAANARLIAAAPEMLEALEAARGAISDELMACGFDEIKQHPILRAHERILKCVEAVIAKAKGE